MSTDDNKLIAYETEKQKILAEVKSYAEYQEKIKKLIKKLKI